MASVLVGVSDRYFSYAFTVGGAGFRIPVDIAFAPGDIFYSLTRGYEHPPRRNLNSRVKMMGMTDEGEQLITHFGELGSDPGKFIWPASIALDDDTNVYVLDEYLARVTVFDKDGELLNHWGDAVGSGDGEMNRPSGLARRDDILFIVDSKNHRVQKFSLDGKYIGQFGSYGSGQGQLDSPWGIGLDKDGNVFVADWRNDRIQSFTADGEWLASFGKPGTGGDTNIVRHHGGLRLVDRTVGEFNRPAGVCVDDYGDIYVADWLNNRVQIFTADGKYITQITGNAGLSKSAKEQLAPAPDLIRQRNLALQESAIQEKLLWAPNMVKFEQSRSRLWISDSNRHRFQIYQKNTESVLNNLETLTMGGAIQGMVA